jgi:hypothetical protein
MKMRFRKLQFKLDFGLIVKPFGVTCILRVYFTMTDTLLILKRKRATLRSNITRYATAINDSTDATTSDDLQYYRNLLQLTLDQLTSLDDTIHGPLNDTKYATDVETCEVYIDSAKRAI